MKNSFLFLLFILLNTPLFSQDLLEQKEIELNEKLLQLRAAKTDEEMNRLNLLFKSEMATFLKIQGVFKYQFKHLKSIAIVDSPDESLRIINWNIEYTDFSYSYCAFVLRWDSEKNVLRVTELIDNLDPYTAKPEGIIEPKNWYGALYYKILPFERNSKIEYLLMGWDGGTTGSNFKIVDVLTFNGNNLKLGSPVFKQNKTVRKRVVFEYADKSSISLRFDPKYKRIVFDHLSPESPGLVGVYSFYVPDMSYDSYSYEDEMWILKEDVIAINEEDKDKMQQIYIIGKDGNVEKKRTKNSWLSPNPDKNSSAIDHVARTPESEDVHEELQESKLPKEKRIKKKDDPNRLLITTGKYKPKKKKKND